jgi:RNA polymerase sigma-70 factor (ECF subfamily)
MANRPQNFRGLAETPGRSSQFETGARAERAVLFEAAVMTHLDSAYTLARYLTRRADVAEDIVQEALLRAYRGFEGQRGENVRAWLLTIVRNCFLTWKARDHEGAEEWNLDGPSVPAESTGSDGQERETPESILIQNEENRAIRSLVEGLPHPFREILVLRDIEDMSYREIADITGVPIGTVMSRLARARNMFATAWKGSKMCPAKERLP